MSNSGPFISGLEAVNIQAEECQGRSHGAAGPPTAGSGRIWARNVGARFRRRDERRRGECRGRCSRAGEVAPLAAGEEEEVGEAECPRLPRRGLALDADTRSANEEWPTGDRPLAADLKRAGAGPSEGRQGCIWGTCGRSCSKSATQAARARSPAAAAGSGGQSGGGAMAILAKKGAQAGPQSGPSIVRIRSARGGAAATGDVGCE